MRHSLLGLDANRVREWAVALSVVCQNPDAVGDEGDEIGDRGQLRMADLVDAPLSHGQGWISGEEDAVALDLAVRHARSVPLDDHRRRAHRTSSHILGRCARPKLTGDGLEVRMVDDNKMGICTLHNTQNNRV